MAGKLFGGKQAPPFGKGAAKGATKTGSPGRGTPKESPSMEKAEEKSMPPAMRARHGKMMKGK